MVDWQTPLLAAGEDVNSPKYAALRAANSGGGGFTPGAGSQQQAIASSIKMYQDANAPAVQSLQSSIPETSSKFAQAKSQLQGSIAPLQERYANILNDLTNRETTDVNNQTKITNSELAKRGITGSSTMAGQEVQNAVQPIRGNYTTQRTNTNLAQQQGISDINSQIANLTPQETDALRAIQNSIAQLQSGAATQGITQGNNAYQFDVNKLLQENAAAESAKQQAITNAFNQTKYNQIDLPTSQANIAKTNTDASNANYNPLAQYGVVSPQQATPQQPYYVQSLGKSIIGVAPDGRYIYNTKDKNGNPDMGWGGFQSTGNSGGSDWSTTPLTTGRTAGGPVRV